MLKTQDVIIRGEKLSELTDKRTYTRKVFLNPKHPHDPSSKKFHFHIAHIHYKDYQGRFKPIDTTLKYDAVLKKYKQTKASYHCTIPIYADDWFTFYNAFEGVNHTIRARPVCSHVTGALIPDQDDGLGHESILYNDAFGQDIDLRVCAYWAGIRKVIIIKKKPAVLKDLFFDFELQLPQHDISISTPIKGKNIRIGRNGKYSYFRNAAIWDSKEYRTSQDIELFTKGGKIYLRKHIPKSVLEKATYPLYTDHPTNYYVGVGDGLVYYTAFGLGNWDAVHDNATGTNAYDTDTILAVRSMDGGFYGCQIDRGFLPINTSGIDDDVAVIAAVLNVYCDAVSKNEDNDGDDWINVVGETNQANPTELITADYNQCGAVNDPAEGSDTRIDIGSLVIDYNQWTFNLTGRGWVKKTAGDPYTMLGLREGHDCIDSPIQPNTSNWVKFRTSEYANTGSDPYLDVTVGVAENPYPTSLLRKDVISGYHCFMQAYMNAKIGGWDPLKLPDGTTF